MKSNYLRRRDLWNPFFSLHHELDRWMEDIAGQQRNENINFMPSCDIEETDSAYRLSFDLPGLKRDEINVSLDGNVLSISGQREDKREERESGGYYLSERSFGKFQRSFQLPNNIDSSKIDAAYDDGVLNLVIPKAEAEKSKKIEIKQGTTNIFKKFSASKKENAA